MSLLSSSELPSETVLHLFNMMLRIRLIEEAIAARYENQEMRCPVHLSTGQEAAAAGVMAALSINDKIFSTHRCHAHYLAKGGSLTAMMAEIFGKATGSIGGRGGSMHLQDPTVGMVASVPIVGGSIPLATGSALADALDQKPRVSVAFFGDATVEEGIFHECANFAVLRNLPILFVCENNLYSVYTPLTERQPSRPLTALAEAHGMANTNVDGNDAEAVFTATTLAVVRARDRRGPTFLQLDTYRWREHCGPNYDNHIGYRSESEFFYWRERDPLALARRRLADLGLNPEQHEHETSLLIKGEIEAAFMAASKAPLPKPEDAKGFVYA